MTVIYPPDLSQNSELIVGPNNSHILIYGIKLDSNKEGKFNIKSVFKTFKLSKNSNVKENKEALHINFHEFCSSDIKEEKIDEN